MTIRVLFVGVDLNAVVRLEGAGAEVRTARPGTIASHSPEDSDVLVVDLDAGGPAVLAEIVDLRAGSRTPDRVVAFYSHVDEEAQLSAAEAGIAALPRGRFWRTLPDVLQPPESQTHS